MGKKSGPKAPDPVKTAEAQAGASKEAIQESARLNRYNIDSPFGSVQWDKPSADPATWSQRIALSPGQQQQMQQQQQIGGELSRLAMGRAGQITEDPFDISGAPQLSTDFSGDAGRVEQSTYDRAMQLMRPGFEERGRRLETDLATKGLPIGGEAYSGEMGRFGRQQREAELAAAMEAVGAGRAEHSRMFGLSQAARQQALSDMQLERTQPMNELAALLQGSPALQGPQVPQAAQYQMAAPDIAGMIQSNYGTRAQQHAQKKAGTTDLAGQGGMITAKVMMSCIPEFQSIDTPEGPRPVDEIRVGDLVTGYNGEPVEVLQKHEYRENPEPSRFAEITLDDESIIRACDMHRIDGKRVQDLRVGDSVGGKLISEIEWYNGVRRSYDLLTGDGGYRISGVPVNSMIEEMAQLASKLKEAS